MNYMHFFLAHILWYKKIKNSICKGGGGGNKNNIFHFN